MCCKVTDTIGIRDYDKVVLHDVIASVIEHETAFARRTQQVHTGMAEFRRIHPIKVGGIQEIYLHRAKIQ